MWLAIKYKVEVFFKEIILDGPFCKTKFNVIRINQGRTSPYIRPFIWIFKTLNLENEDPYIAFIEKKINGQLPDHLNNPELFELVKAFQIHAHPRTRWNYDRMNVDSPMVDILLKGQLLQN